MSEANPCPLSPKILLQNAFIYAIIRKTNNGHRRTVHRSVGDSKRMLAGRLSDKMSSELGYYFIVIGEFFILEDLWIFHF